MTELDARDPDPPPANELTMHQPLPIWVVATVIAVALVLALLVWFGYDRWSDIVQ